MLKIKKGFLLRRLGTEHMAVAIGEAGKEFNGMIRLNGTGAFYWKELEQFEGVDEETAAKDVKEFLESISIALDDDTADD